MRIKAALMSQNCHSNISTDSVGLKPNTVSLPALSFPWVKHLAFHDEDQISVVKKKLLSEIQDVHSATSGLAAVIKVCLNPYSMLCLISDSYITMTPYTDSATVKRGRWETLTFKFCQHNSTNQQELVL